MPEGKIDSGDRWHLEQPDYFQWFDVLPELPASIALVVGNDYSGRLAANNIRRELAAAFPTARIQVRNPSHGVVDLLWDDWPSERQIEAIVRRYRASLDTPAGRQPVVSDWIERHGGADFIRLKRRKTPLSRLYSKP